jgi:hypothetical protein
MTATLIDRLALPLFFALLTALAAVGAGGVWRRSGSSSLTLGLSRALILGLPIFGTIAFLAGTIRISLSIMAVLLFAFAAAGIVVAFREWRGRETSRVSFSWTGAAFAALAGVSLVEVIAVAQLPAISLDEVAYHLSVIHTWILEGRVVSLPLLSHSFFPFGVESAFLPVLTLLGPRGAIGAHFVNIFVAAATLVVAWQFVERRAGRRQAEIAAIALLVTPAMLAIAGWAWNDWPLLGAVILLLDALDRDELSAWSIGLPIAAGLLTKYTFVAPAIVLIVARVLISKQLERPLVRGILAGGLAGSVFFLRNLITTGNPFAPMFGALAPEVSQFRRSDSFLASLRGYVFDARFADESLGITLLLLVILGLLRWRDAGARHRAFLIASCISIVTLTITLPSSRILVPSLALAALVGSSIASTAGRWVSRIVLGAFAIAALVQLSIALLYLDTLHPFDVLTGRVTEERYLLGLPMVQESTWANALLPAGSRTLVVGLNALFWFDQPVRGGGNFDGPRVSAYLERGTPAELRNRLRGDGITHVAIFDRGLMLRDDLRRERATNLSPAAIANLRALVNEFATPVREDGNRHLFALR